MPNIIPHLWYDNEAKQAAELYTSVFGNSRIKSTATLHDTPSGTVELIAIEIAGQEFRLLKAGPFVKFTPAVSFLVACSSKDEVDAIWSALSEGGMALMELGNYPFSERYGWTQDRFGLSWQVMFMGGREIKQKIIPTLMFVDNQCGKAEEAITFYASVFPNASVDHIMRYGANEPPDADGTIRHAAFTLNGQQFAAMDSARAHNFGFNEAISFIVRCDTQQELDSFSAKLSAVPEAEQCGWIKDRYRLSWQIAPALMDEMMGDEDQARLDRVTQAFLKMKRFDIKKLEEAYANRSQAETRSQKSTQPFQQLAAKKRTLSIFPCSI